MADHYGILVAKTEGGLVAVAGDDFEIIEETVRPFKSLVTYSDPPSTAAGHIKTGEPGWIALGKFIG